MSVPALVLVLPAFVCVLAWVGAGSLVPARRLPDERLQRAVCRFAAGSLAWSLALFCAGRAGAFSETAIRIATVVVAVVGLRWAWSRRAVLRVALPRDRLVLALAALVVVALVVDIVAASAPPTSADALKYHLALPERWLHGGQITDPFWRWESFGPSAMEMLYAQGLALGGGGAAAVLHAVFAAATAVAVFGAARELAGSIRPAACAAALFVLQGLVTWEATSAFVDLALAFYVALAFWAAMTVRGRAVTRSAAWTGVAAGAAAGVKYLGLAAGALALAGAVAAAEPRVRIRVALIGSGFAVAACCAWYLKNLVVTGNPIYPVAFGGREWTPFAQSQLHEVAVRYGVGSPLRLPLLPLDLIVHGGAFDRGQYVSTASWLLAPFALLSRRRRTAAVALCGVVVYVVAWRVLSPQARFLLPALVALAVLGGVGAGCLLQRNRVATAAVGLVGAGVLATWAAPSAVLVRQLVPPVVGAESSQHFLQRLTGTYDAFRSVAARTDGEVGFDGYAFVFNFPGARAFEFAAPEFAPDVPASTYFARLRAMRARYMLVNNLTPGPEARRLRGCARRVAVYHATYVTSRSLGTGAPMLLGLYSLSRCLQQPTD